MTRYRVILMPEPLEAIREHARYLAEEKHAPVTAERWLKRVFKVAEGLEQMPLSGSLAPENELTSYEVRMRLIGKFLLLYTVVEAECVVRVIGFRHGSRLPRRGDLPADPAG